MVRPAWLPLQFAVIAAMSIVAPAAVWGEFPHRRPPAAPPPRVPHFQPPWLPHSLKAWNHHGIPNHDYQLEPSRPSVQAVTLLAVDDPPGNGNRKLFRLSTAQLTIDHIVLEQVFASLEKTQGNLVFSGRVINGGGRSGELLGNFVTVRVRCFGGSKLEGVHPPDGPMFAEIETRRWVAARKPENFSIRSAPAPLFSAESTVNGNARANPPSMAFVPLVQHFDEIRRLEVTLEYEKGR